MSYLSTDSVPKCWRGDFQVWRSSKRTQKRLFCGYLKRYVSSIGEACRTCKEEGGHFKDLFSPVLVERSRIVACIHRGKTKRTEKKTCCGVVEIFDCPKLGHEVLHTKCYTCKEYTPSE